MEAFIKNCICLISLSLIFFFKVEAIAAPCIYEIKDNNKKLIMEIPIDWKIFKNEFGIPFVLVGPKNLYKRPVLSFSSTIMPVLKFDDIALAKKQKEYQDSKNDWLKQRHGILYKFNQYSVTKINKDIELRRIGIEYGFRAEKFTEEFIMLKCGKSLVFINSLLPKNDEESKFQYGKKMELILNSINCI